MVFLLLSGYHQERVFDIHFYKLSAAKAGEATGALTNKAVS